MEVNVIIVILALGAGLWDVETDAVTVTEEEGRDIEITCSHSNAFTKDKYFCKGDCRHEDVLVHTTEKPSNEKYSIRDEGNTFYVTISDLTMDDTGLYWCGIDRIGVDTFTQVDLIVTERTGSNTSSSRKLLYIWSSLGVVVLGLVIVLIIFIKHRNRDKDRDGDSKSTGQDYNPIYSRPTKQRQDAPPDTSASTANENVERGDETTAISEGGLFYSSVSFDKHTDCSTGATDTPTVTYSVMKHKPTDEATIYCNV